MRCLAVDDEPLALDVIKGFCSKVDFIENLDTVSSAIEAAKYLNSTKADLMFIDINMPHLSGIEFVQILDNPPMIIFTTAYPNFALSGFELNAVDYIVKPFSFERFFKAVTKAHELFNLKQQSVTVNEQQPDYLMVKVEYSTVKVKIEEILYVEGLKDYIKIVTKDKGNIVTKSTMKNIEDRLPLSDFIRVHKSFIVNFNHVDAFESNHIVISGTKIPLGSNNRDAFLALLEKNRL